MNETNRIKFNDTERYIQCQLSSQQLKQLIVAKFERAKMYHEALKKREAPLVESR